MGRPKANIDPATVEELAKLHCTLEEMAAFFGVDISTISKRFSKELAKGREVGKMSLRRKQISVAMGGNVAMLIWLGKQYLGQRDKADVDLQGGLNMLWDDKLNGL